MHSETWLPSEGAANSLEEMSPALEVCSAKRISSMAGGGDWGSHSDLVGCLLVLAG